MSGELLLPSEPPASSLGALASFTSSCPDEFSLKLGEAAERSKGSVLFADRRQNIEEVAR